MNAQKALAQIQLFPSTNGIHLQRRNKYLQSANKNKQKRNN